MALQFLIERSANGRDFVTAGAVSSHNDGNEINRYHFIDPFNLSERTWYRVVMLTLQGKKKYSSIIRLQKKFNPGITIENLANPFNNSLGFAIITDRSSVLLFELFDMTGRVVLSDKQRVLSGTSNIQLTNAQSLPRGVYTLQVSDGERSFRSRVIKR